MKVDDSLTEAEVARIAEEAYLYLYPLVTMDITRRVAGNVPANQRPGFGPMNHFNHIRAFPPGDFKEVVRPNFDTLYSPLWFDVRDEPLVISTPDTAGRYYMLPMLDMWTDVFAVPGSRTTGTREGRYALVGPRWAGELPAEVQRVDAPTPFGWVLCRIQTNGVADYGAVNALQDGFVAAPLSRWPAEPAAVEFSPDPEVDMGTKPLEQVESMAGIEFMTYGLSRMALHPPHLIDQPMLARMSRRPSGKLWLGVSNGAYLLGAAARAAVTGNTEFIFYLLVMLVLIGADLVVDRRVRLSPMVLWMLSIWGLLHMAGGTVPIDAALA